MPADEMQERLWRGYRSRLFGFVVKRVADPAAAEDIVHDVLLRAYSRRETLRDGTRFEPWLYRITRNAVIDHYRSRRPADPLPADLVAAEPPGPDARNELAACMGPLIEALPDRYREAIVLSELQGLTQQETAIRLGLSLSGAKSRVQRGRRLLERRILDCCRVEQDSRGGIVDYRQTNGCGPMDSAREEGAACSSE